MPVEAADRRLTSTSPGRRKQRPTETVTSVHTPSRLVSLARTAASPAPGATRTGASAPPIGAPNCGGTSDRTVRSSRAGDAGRPEPSETTSALRAGAAFATTLRSTDCSTARA